MRDRAIIRADTVKVNLLRPFQYVIIVSSTTLVAIIIVFLNMEWMSSDQSKISPQLLLNIDSVFLMIA